MVARYIFVNQPLVISELFIYLARSPTESEYISIKKIVNKDMNLIDRNALKYAGLKPYKFLDDVTRLPYVKEIYLFGSRARGDFDERSDIDIAINCQNASTEDWNNLMQIFEDAPILNHIDPVRYDTLKDGLFKQQIDKYKLVLYAKN